jgi:uncharacterized membrane protein YedE/YeeE
LVGLIFIPYIHYFKKDYIPVFSKNKLSPAGSVDLRLVIGSLIFGVGWGLAGICPGPGVVVAICGNLKALVWVGCMIAGFWIFEFYNFLSQKFYQVYEEIKKKYEDKLKRMEIR